MVRGNYNLISIIILFCFSCTKENKQTDPQNNFKIFWNDFNANYPAFQLNNVNWDSVYTVNFSKINPNTTDFTLLSIINSSILTLKDAHSDLNNNHDYYDVFIHQKPTNFISSNLINSKYIQEIKTNQHSLRYGKVISQDIGYFSIASFADTENDYNLIDSFLVSFQNSKGIIIDVRQNGGGNEAYGRIVASRFTNQSIIYRYGRYRNGPQYSDLSDFLPVVLNPDGKIKYAKTVMLLSNRHTVSSAEDFILMLNSLPNVIQIGDTTFGGVASNPIAKSLPNGWTYRMSTQVTYDKNKIPIKGGIAPQIPVYITKSDSIQGIDRILEEAINKINEK
jgi:hypothetical protein